MDCVCSKSSSQCSDEKPSKDKFMKQESNSKSQNRILYTMSSNEIRAFEIFDSLRKNEELCDVKLETDDGAIVHAHKVVLSSGTPYFRAMFTSFRERKMDHIVLRGLDSTALKLLIKFIYTARIMISDHNVQALLHTANHLMLLNVREACFDFLLAQLNLTNCFGIKSLVTLYDCEEHLSNLKSYIQQNFRNVVESNEFLHLKFEEVAELISYDELNDPSEEKVFECVINWVNHDSSCRENVLPKLMEHVRLPLISKNYLLNKVKEEPLIKNSIECRSYLYEALNFKFIYEWPDIFPQTIRTIPRKPKVILAVVEGDDGNSASIQWYDSSIDKWQVGPDINTTKFLKNLTVLNDRHLFFLRGLCSPYTDCKVYTLDLQSPHPCLQQSVSMSTYRLGPGVGVLGNCIYAIGGADDSRSLKSAEFFDFVTQKWKMIADMSTARYSCGVGVLNNHVYAVGGINETQDFMKSVERYCPKSDTWMSVASMSVDRFDFGVGIVNDILYAVGGYDGRTVQNLVEAYNPVANIWTTVSSMNEPRRNAGVVVLNGLLYAVGGEDENRKPLSTAEMYDPKSNCWFMISDMAYTERLFSGAVIISKPIHF